MKDCMEALTEGLDLDWNGLFSQYKNALTKVKTAISGEAFIDNVCTDYFSPENSPIRTDIENTLKELYKKYCFWNKDGKTHVKIMHNPAQNAYANKIGFDKKTYGSTDEDKNQYSVQNNAFIYYRFGNNNTGESVLNQVTEFRFLNAENNIDFSITGNAFPISNHQQGNQYLIFECNPIGSQTPFKGAIAKEDAIQTYTIENFSIPAYYCKIEGNSWDDDHFNFSGLRNINEFTEQLNSGSNYPESDYIEFTSIEEITLKIKAPIVTVSPTWEQNQ